MANNLGNLILEQAAAPGTSPTFSLTGAIPGRVPYRSQFVTGDTPFYFATDQVSAEAGYGMFVSGAPDQLGRTVLWNSAGSTDRMNFTGSVYVLNEVPASLAIYVGADGILAPPQMQAISLNAADFASIFANGVMTFQSGSIVHLIGSSITLNGTGSIPVTVSHNGVEVARFNNGNLSIGCATDTPNTPAFTEGLAIRAPGFSGAMVSAYRNTGDFIELGTASSGNAMIFRSAGSQVGSIAIGPSATVFNTTSDYRIKVNIHPLTGALERLSKLPLIRHGWLKPSGHPEVDGALAHDVVTVVPEAVTGEKDAVDASGEPILQQVDWSKLMPLALASSQELHAMLLQLMARMTALETALARR